MENVSTFFLFDGNIAYAKHLSLLFPVQCHECIMEVFVLLCPPFMITQPPSICAINFASLSHAGFTITCSVCYPDATFLLVV